MMTEAEVQEEFKYLYNERLAILTRFLPSGVSEREPDKEARQIARREATEWVMEHGNQ